MREGAAVTRHRIPSVCSRITGYREKIDAIVVISQSSSMKELILLLSPNFLPGLCPNNAGTAFWVLRRSYADGLRRRSHRSHEAILTRAEVLFPERQNHRQRP